MPMDVLLMYCRHYKKRDRELMKSLFRILIQKVMELNSRYTRIPELKEIIPLESELEEMKKNIPTEDQLNTLWEQYSK